MNRWLKYLLISGTMVLCVGYLVFAVPRSRCMFNKQVCTNVEINITDYGNRTLINSNEIGAFLAAEKLNLIGKTFYRIQTKAIEDAIQQHPMVRNVECNKTPRGEIRINVVPRKPILRVIGIENYYVDDLRKPIPVSPGHTAYVPIFTGNISKKTAVNTLYDFAQFLLENEFWNNQIEQINIVNSKEVQLSPRVGDHIILLGSLDRFEQKLEKLRKFYLYGLNEIGWNNYSKIDLRYKDQVVCTKK